MPRCESGRFLTIFIESPGKRDESLKRLAKIMAGLREWANGHNPPVEIHPFQGVSDVIEITSSDTVEPSEWERIKKEAIAIIEKGGG